jgi:hypothetical protein
MTDHLDESWGEAIDRLDREKKSVGRPATGQNTKVIRVPKDFDRDMAIKMYYDWLPIIEEYRSIVKENPLAVRNEKLTRMLEELGML